MSDEGDQVKITYQCRAGYARRQQSRTNELYMNYQAGVTEDMTYVDSNTFPAKTTWAPNAMYVILTIAEWGGGSVSRLKKKIEAKLITPGDHNW